MSSRRVARLTPSVTRQNRRCINCSFLIPKNLPTYLLKQASTSIINLLQSWITPTQISKLERICAACWSSATREVQCCNQHDSNRPGLSEAILPEAGSSGDLNIP